MLGLILNQVRMKDWNRSDLNAIVAACRMAARRVTELCDRFGPETYISVLDALLQRNFDAMKQLIATTIPENETLTFTDYICDDGMGFGPYRIHCSMYREGDGVVLDFEGTDPQSPGSINYYLNENLYKMFFGIYMIMVFDPQILWNDGFYPLVDVRIPQGTLLKPDYPGGAVVPHPRAGPHLRHPRRPARAAAAGVPLRRRVLVVAAPHVLGVPAGRRVVPALPDRLRRHPRPAVRRRARRALAVAVVLQRAERVPRGVLPAADRVVRDGRRTPAAPGSSAAATGSTSSTGSSSRARSRSTTTAGSPTPGASTAASPARARASGWSAPTARARCWPASATTSRSRRATSCTT